jgi:hypothetical protein
MRPEWAASRLSRPASPHSEARHVGRAACARRPATVSQHWATTAVRARSGGSHRPCGAAGLARLTALGTGRAGQVELGWTEGPRPALDDRRDRARGASLSPLRTARQADSQSASIRRETVRTARPASGDRQGGHTAARDAPAPFPVPSCVVRDARTLSEQSHASSVARPRTGAGGAARRPGVGAGSAGALDPLEPDSAERWTNAL